MVAQAEMVNSAQTPQCREIKKETPLNMQSMVHRGSRWNMKTSTKDKLKRQPS